MYIQYLSSVCIYIYTRNFRHLLASWDTTGAGKAVEAAVVAMQKQWHACDRNIIKADANKACKPLGGSGAYLQSFFFIHTNRTAVKIWLKCHEPECNREKATNPNATVKRRPEVRVYPFGCEKMIWPHISNFMVESTWDLFFMVERLPRI